MNSLPDWRQITVVVLHAISIQNNWNGKMFTKVVLPVPLWQDYVGYQTKILWHVEWWYHQPASQHKPILMKKLENFWKDQVGSPEPHTTQPKMWHSMTIFCLRNRRKHLFWTRVSSTSNMKISAKNTQWAWAWFLATLVKEICPAVCLNA